MKLLPFSSPSLFWRTFLLIILLIAASLLAWAQSFRVYEREPRAKQIAQQFISIVNITRTALLYSSPQLRRELLEDLADNEGVRVVALEPTDKVEAFPDTALVRLIAALIQERLGPQTRIAEQVNGVSGAWISFNIEEDAYWVFIERDPLLRNAGLRWVQWALSAMLLSVFAAIAITRVVNRPLAQLSSAVKELGAGRSPMALPETGPIEIRTVNQNFNRMVSDLKQLEQDRAVLLAGISHDVRTPLTRLRLELELSELAEDTKAAMVADIEQIDAIVKQFLEYARRSPQAEKQIINLSELMQQALTRLRASQLTVTLDIEPNLFLPAYGTDLDRALDNLLTNASRYGRDPQGQLNLQVSARRDGSEAMIEIADQGAGIAIQDQERLLRPFERGITARSGSEGAGLGLAIVARVVQQHGGRLSLLTNQPQGLKVRLRLPLSNAPNA